MQITNPMLNRAASLKERESFTTTTNTGTAASSAQVSKSNNAFEVNRGPTSGTTPPPLLSNVDQLINGADSGEVLNALKQGAQTIAFSANPLATLQAVIDQPAQGNAYQPAQGNAYQPAQGNAYQPAQGNAYQPAQANPYQPAQANPYQPAQANPYQPAQANPYQANGSGNDVSNGPQGNDTSSTQPAAPSQSRTNPMNVGNLGGGGPGVTSSLQNSRVGAGPMGENGDYGSIKSGARDGFEHWADDTTLIVGSATAGADSEHYVGDGDIILAANAGAGASLTGGHMTFDEEGRLTEHAYGTAMGNISAGARFSSDVYDETGFRETTAGAGVGANAYVGGSWGDGDSSSSVGVSAAADLSAEGTITTSRGVPVGVAGNIGGDLGIEGEISHSKTTDVGTSNVSVTGGADIGMGVGGELGMTGDGKFVAGAELDLGPIGGGVYFELDTLVMKDRGHAIDDYWNDGRRNEAVTQTADLVLDTLETLPGLGNAVGGVRDLGYGAEKAFNEFADGDVLGGVEALGDGLLDTMENLPFTGDALANLRDWVTGGGIKEVAGSALDVLEDIAEADIIGGVSIKDVVDANIDIAEDALDLGKDIAKAGLSGTKAVLDLNKDIAEGAGKVLKDGAEAIIGEKAVDDIEDAGEAVVDGIEDAGKAVWKGIKSIF